MALLHGRHGALHPVPFLFLALVAAWRVGMGLTVGSTRNAQFLLRCCGDVSRQAAREHRESEHKQEFLRRHAAFSSVWDIGPESWAGVCGNVRSGVKKGFCLPT